MEQTPRPRPYVKTRMDGTTWMVSVVHPDNGEESDKWSSSSWYSERAGKTPLQAAQSYYDDDPSDNPGSALCRSDPELVIICVIGQQIAPSGKPWMIHLFALDSDNKIVPFP